MFYSSITQNSSMETVKFVNFARALNPRVRARGYTTDEFGCDSLFAPAVYLAADGSGFLAGYRIANTVRSIESEVWPDEEPPVIVADTIYPSASLAAIAADRLADVAAEAERSSQAIELADPACLDWWLARSRDPRLL